MKGKWEKVSILDHQKSTTESNGSTFGENTLGFMKQNYPSEHIPEHSAG